MTALIPEPTATAEPTTPAETAVGAKPAVGSDHKQPLSRRVLIGGTVWLLGVLVLGFIGYLGVFSGLQQNRTQSVLFDKMRAELRTGTAPTTGPVSAGQPVAVLTIPALHLKQVVIEGTSSRDLTAGPGVEPGSPLPGQLGTSVILGRRAGFGGPFRNLDDLKPGDVIDIASGAGALIYTVDAKWRSDLSHPAPPASSSRLTLITSDPVWAPTRSLVVTAKLTKGTPGAANSTTAAGAADQPLARDNGAGLSLYLWSQLAFIAVVALLRYHTRVHRSVLWIGGLPFLLVVLWHIYPDVAALLPNTL